MKDKIGVVGMGYVGEKIYDFFKSNKYIVYSYDPNNHGNCATLEELNNLNLDFAFVCVPTPMAEDGSCNTSIVEQVVRGLEAKTIVIESTIPPGTTNYFEKETNKDILFTPEYFGETPNHPLNSLNSRDFFVIGGRPEIRKRLTRIYKDIFPSNIKFALLSSTAAEIVKYMENSYLANKVIFVEEFQKICDCFGEDYDPVREAWLLDPRVDPSHTFPGKGGEPGFGGKCLPKDLSAIIYASRKKGHNPELLQAVFNYNKKLRGELL